MKGKGSPDTEIVNGVLRIIKPGTFKDMLINKDGLSVSKALWPYAV